MAMSRRVVVAGLVTVAAAQVQWAIAAPPVAKHQGFAIGGFDPTAYFTDKKPVHGRVEFSHTWRDSIWLFASAQNRAKFAANPDAFAPQYGGHCAMNMVSGKLSGGDPDAWSVVGGKLYLNGSVGTRDRWLMGVYQNIAKADEMWARYFANK